MKFLKFHFSERTTKIVQAIPPSLLVMFVILFNFLLLLLFTILSYLYCI